MEHYFDTHMGLVVNTHSQFILLSSSGCSEVKWVYSALELVLSGYEVHWSLLNYHYYTLPTEQKHGFIAAQFTLWPLQITDFHTNLNDTSDIGNKSTACRWIFG